MCSESFSLKTNQNKNGMKDLKHIVYLCGRGGELCLIEVWNVGLLALQLTWTLAIYFDELLLGGLEDAFIRNLGTLKKL